MNDKNWIPKGLLFKCITGSRAYGTSIANSDLDIRGVFAGDQRDVMTPFGGQDQIQGPGDTILFELSKYVRMICQQNPNIVELLWVEPDCVLFQTPAWGLLRDIRQSLLTTQVRHTYGGFAIQQLGRMKSHLRWINNPQPENPPRPRDFMRMEHNFSLGSEFDDKVPSEGKWTAIATGKDAYHLFPGGRGTWFDEQGNLRSNTREQAGELALKQPVARLRFDRASYETRKRDHDHYWTWKRNRNPDRGALEEKQGYDGKAASHTIRLLRTAKEILEEGIVHVRRSDAAELLEIRQGKVSFEHVLEMAARLDEELILAAVNSCLPKEVDKDLVADIVIRMYEMSWKSRERLETIHPVHLSARSLHKGRFVVLDIEATGLPRPDDKIVEIGVVEIFDGRITGRSFHAYINPGCKIGRIATSIHGLTVEFLADKPRFEDISNDLSEFIGNDPVIAHEAAADMRMLNRELIHAGQAPVPSTRAFCTRRLAARMFPNQNPSLDLFADALGVDRSARKRGHAAMLDATLAARCVLVASEAHFYEGLERYALSVSEKRFIESPKKESSLYVFIDGQDVRFKLPEGVSLSSPVPDYPKDTHELIVRRTGITVRKIGDVIPDNPIDDAVVGLHKGEIRRLRFENGKRQSAVSYAPIFR
jgi:uncharacterized protein